MKEVREELRRNAQTSAVLLQAVQEVKEALHAGGGQIADELEHLQAAVRRAVSGVATVSASKGSCSTSIKDARFGRARADEKPRGLRLASKVRATRRPSALSHDSSRRVAADALTKRLSRQSRGEMLVFANSRRRCTGCPSRRTADG